MANEIQKSSDLWDLEHHLSQRRKEIDRKHDFRGSQLQVYWGDSCTKIDSVRKICADCGKRR